MPACPARLHAARPRSARTRAALAAWLTARPGDRPEILEQKKARKATEKQEWMVHSIEAAPIAAKNAHARCPRPAPNRTETVPCRAVPSRTAPHRTV
eukprot:6791994-Prymnesium_polylepis.1